MFEEGIIEVVDEVVKAHMSLHNTIVFTTKKSFKLWAS